MADALTDIAELSLSSGELKNGALVRPHVSLLLSEQNFSAARRELGRRAQVADTLSAETRSDPGRPSSGSDGDATAGVAAAAARSEEPATLEDGTPVPLTEMARLLCDCEVTRIVVDADDQPVNLGRTQRLFSREQRRAVIARDRTCRFLGCSRPARWCEVHQIDWWERDTGETSIPNDVLLCSFHHHEVHRGTVQINRTEKPTAVASRGEDADPP